MKLRGNSSSSNSKSAAAQDLTRCLLFRQNENNQVAIYGKLPAPGHYALDVYAKPWAADTGSFPVVATYLIASSAECLDKQPFPMIQKQLAGATTENIK